MAIVNEQSLSGRGVTFTSRGAVDVFLTPSNQAKSYQVSKHATSRTSMKRLGTNLVFFSHYRLLHRHPYCSFAYNDRVFVSGLASIGTLIFPPVMTCNQNHDNLGEPDHQKLTQDRLRVGSASQLLNLAFWGRMTLKLHCFIFVSIFYKKWETIKGI